MEANEGQKFFLFFFCSLFGNEWNSENNIIFNWTEKIPVAILVKLKPNDWCSWLYIVEHFMHETFKYQFSTPPPPTFTVRVCRLHCTINICRLTYYELQSQAHISKGIIKCTIVYTNFYDVTFAIPHFSCRYSSVILHIYLYRILNGVCSQTRAQVCAVRMCVFLWTKMPY